MQDCFKKISELEDSIDVELKEIDSIDFTKKDEKEQKMSLDVYESCQIMSEKSCKKMNDITGNLNKLVSKIKPLVIPDEGQWNNWTGRDFKKSVS